jgi:hypothetical protein
MAPSQDTCPESCRCLAEDAAARRKPLQVPTQHRQDVRTSHLAERALEEERRRTKVIPDLGDKASLVKLVCAVLMRVSERCLLCDAVQSCITYTYEHPRENHNNGQRAYLTDVLDKLFTNLLEVALAVGMLAIEQQVSVLAPGRQATSEQVPSRPHIGGTDIGLRQHAAAE